MTIWNATQHFASQDQIDAGVRDLQGEVKARIKELLTFDAIEVARDVDAVKARATAIVELLKQEGAVAGDEVMIGGALFLMRPLTLAVEDAEMAPVFAFTKRIVTENDGRKVVDFVHEGFVPA